jgi:hypothetical protein
MVRSRFKSDSRVKTMSYRSALIHLRGVAPGIVVADELTEDEVRELREQIIDPGHHIFLAHYWTPR